MIFCLADCARFLRRSRRRSECPDSAAVPPHGRGRCFTTANFPKARSGATARNTRPPKQKARILYRKGRAEICSRRRLRKASRKAFLRHGTRPLPMARRLQDFADYSREGNGGVEGFGGGNPPTESCAAVPFVRPARESRNGRSPVPEAASAIAEKFFNSPARTRGVAQGFPPFSPWITPPWPPPSRKNFRRAA